MISLKILPPITRKIIYDIKSEESSKKKDSQIEWLKAQNIILQEKLISSCDDCLSLKKENSFLKENLASLKKKNSSFQEIIFDTEVIIKDIHYDKGLSIENHNCILAISERDTFLFTFDNSIRIQYEILEEEFLNKVKNSFINEDDMYIWEIGNISPRLYRELCFDKKNNSYWKNKDGEITYFFNIFNKINTEFILIVNGDGIDGFDAVIKKTRTNIC